MATYDDLSAGFNNSAGLSLADALAVRNASVSIPSLAEQKNSRLADRLAEKQSRLNPVPDYPSSMSSGVDIFDRGGDSGLSDLAHASVLRAGGNIMDAGKGISNKLFGTEFDDSEATGYSNQSLADQEANVSLAYRKNLVDDQTQVLQDIKDDNWWEATKSAGNVAFRTAADSAATVPELAAGAVLTPVAGTGGVIIGRKIKNISETASDIAKRYDQLSKTKTGKFIGKGFKEAGKASFLTADIVQQQRNQYKAENNGEEMSAERLAGSVLSTLATTIWQPTIAKKFFISPKLGKTSKADGNFRKRMQKEIQGVMDTADNGVMKNLSLRIGEGIKGIAAAGGAEMVQEYAQFWAETLSVKMKPDETTGFLQAALNEFQKEGNQDSAIQAAFLGGAAGGATKVATSTPGNVIGAAKDTSLSVTNKIVQEGKRRTSEAMSNSGVTQQSAQNRAKSRAAKKFAERTLNDLETVESAETISDVGNETLLKRMTKTASGRDLNDPEVFSAVKNQTLSTLKSESEQVQLADKGRKVADVATNIAKAVTETVSNFAKEVLTDDQIEKIKAVPGVISDKVVAEIKDFPKSTTRGLLEAAGTYSLNKSKEGLSTLRKQAKESGVEATRKLADVMNDEAPDAAKALRESANKMEAAERRAGIRNDNLTTNKNMSSLIHEAASLGVNKDSVDSAMVEVFEASYGEFDSEATVDTVRKAIKNISNTEEFKSLPNADRVEFLAVEANLRRKVGPKSRNTTETVVEGVKKATDEVSKQAGKAFSLLSDKKGGPDKSFKDSALNAINDAFVKFVKGESTSTEQLVITDQSKTTKDSKNTLKVYKVPGNSSSEVIATVNTAPMAQLKKTFEGAAQTAKDTNDDSGLKLLISGMTSGPGLKMLTTAIKSKDPVVIQTLLNHLAPVLLQGEYALGIFNKLKESLGDKTNGKTEPKVETKAESKPEPKTYRGKTRSQKRL